MSWHPLWLTAPNAEAAIGSLLQSLANDVVSDDNGGRQRKILSEFCRRGLICLEDQSVPARIGAAWTSAINRYRAESPIAPKVYRELHALTQIVLTSPVGGPSPFAKAEGNENGIFDTGRLISTSAGAALTAKNIAPLVEVLSGNAQKIQIIDRYFLSEPNEPALFGAILGALVRRVPQSNVKIEVLCGPQDKEREWGEKSTNAFRRVKQIIQDINPLSTVHIHLAAGDDKFRLHDRAMMFWITPTGGNIGSTRRCLSLGQGAASLQTFRSVIVHDLSTEAFDGVWKEISENCRIIGSDAHP